LGVVALAAAACGMQAGCYKHVVRTEGYGARAEEVYEPNLDDKPSPVDTLLWGDPPENTKRRKR
jgi:hypothetical protein